MDDKTNNASGGSNAGPTIVEDPSGQDSNTKAMVNQVRLESCPQEDETNLLSKSESVDDVLSSTNKYASSVERDEAFREDVPRSVGSSSSRSDNGRAPEKEDSNDDKKVASQQGKGYFTAANEGFIEDCINQDQPTTSNTFDSNSTASSKSSSSTINDAAITIDPNKAPDEVSPFPSKPQGYPDSLRTYLRNAWGFVTHRLHCGSDSSSDSHEERSRDWLFMSVVTLGVSALDKLFDVLFLLTLLQEEEWVFLGVGLTFTVASTITTSLFAAQSFWLQTSQIPTWSSAWVQQVPFEKTVFLHEKFSKPINRRILPESSMFAEPEQVYDTHDGASTSSSSSPGSAVTAIVNNVNNLQLEIENSNFHGKNDELGDADNLTIGTSDRFSHGQRRDEETPTSYGVTNSLSQAEQPSCARPQSSITSRVNGDIRKESRNTEDNNDATDSRAQSSPPDAADCGAEQPMKQQFQPWVKRFVIAMFCTGLLPEAVLVIHLVLYAKAGSKRRTICKALRETWFVQTLKLGEALLESIPQIHLKMFYYLVRYREADLSGIFDNEEFEWLTTQTMGLLVNGASICIGILHVHVMFKILAFIFLFMNLATRIAVCATLDFVTVSGVYFIPFGVAFVVSAAAMLVITVFKRGQFRPGTRKLEKYIGIPVMRTFCKPPVDVPGVAVSVVFVAASIVCAHFMSDGGLSLLAVVVVCGAIVGQVLPGLAWHATGITSEHEENKRRKSIELDSLELNTPDDGGEGLRDEP